jgi:Fe-S-cluster containining protein
MENHCNICSFNCWGREGHDASCCTLEDRNWIIGPHKDTEAFLGRLSEKIGRKVKFQEVFYDYEEGHKKFPDKEVWQSTDNYPALRVDEENKRLPCVNYNIATRSCMVYDIRPQICKDYVCDYLSSHLVMNN